MKNVLILEDNIATLDAIEKMFNEIDASINVYRATALAEAYQAAMEHDINVFIIDIMLDNTIRNDVSGLVFVEKIRTIERYAFVPIIFLTSLADPELHAYRKLHCYGYLEKPLFPEEAKKIIIQALKFQQPERRNDTVYFRKDGVIYAIDKKDIVYIKSHGGKITLKTVKDEVDVYYRNCRNMLKQLDSDKFMQSNRSTIVNKEFIENIDIVNRVITLMNGYGRLELGIRMKKELMERMDND